jgi:hypothetical protein
MKMTEAHVKAVLQAIDEPQAEAEQQLEQMQYYRQGSVRYRQCAERAIACDALADRLAEVAAHLRRELVK